MEREKESLRETLIGEAMAILETGGEFSLRTAARRAGVSAMAPYRHFEDKAELRASVLERGFAALGEALARADAAPDPRAALLAQGLAYVAFARSRPHLFRAMFSGPAGDGVAGAACMESYQILARRVIALAAGDPEPATLACWSLVHGLATLALDGRLPRLDPAQERAALALFVDALLKEKRPDAP